MRFALTHPLVAHPSHPDLVTGAGVAAVARAAERAGFSGMGFTDHPAPTQRWLDAGGHDALDPFVALSYVAATTERIRLIPNIVVLPYRNPFLVAKAAATLDVLSGGRFVLAVGTGYLRAEFAALGVERDERNDLFDEALEVVKQVWSSDEVSVRGRHFRAEGVTAHPRPTSRSGPPVWIGGNSELARRRVATAGDGWAPFPAPAGLARTARTAPLETAGDLAVLLEDLWERVAAAGRDRAEIDVCFTCSAGGDPFGAGFDADAHLEGLRELAALGVTWVQVSIPGDDLGTAVDAVERYGEQVIAPAAARW